MPGLDWLLAALARAGMVSLWTDPANAPSANQQTTVWLKTSASSWATEGSVYLWDTTSSSFKLATPSLWSTLFKAVWAALSKETGLTTSKVLTAADAGQLYTNTNAGTILFTLPVAATAPGAEFEFAVTVAGQISVLAGASVLRFGAAVAPTGLVSTNVGSYLKVRSINGQWFVTGAEGAWVA